MSEVYIKLFLSFLFSTGILLLTNKYSKNIYSLRLISGYYTFQFLIIIFYLLEDSNALVWNTDFPTYRLKSSLDPAIIGYIIFQVGILFSSFAGRFLLSTNKIKKNITTSILNNSKALTLPLLITAFIIFSYPLISHLPFIGYISSILFNYLNFIPFIAGVLFFKNPKIRLFWIVSLITLFTFGILTGGRGTAMTCAVLYCFGFFYSLVKPSAKRFAVILALILGIPLMAFMSFVGVYRGIVGRVPLNEITFERAINIYEKYQKIKDSKILDLNSDIGKLNGVGRLVNFVNILQFNIVPSQRPYEGFQSFFTVDLPFAFDIAFISGSTVEDRLRAKAFAFRLNDYGYYNTLTSSVEYSLVTDSYIRGGFGGVFIFAFLIGITTQVIELFLFFFRNRYPIFAIFALIMVLQQALLGYAYCYLVIVRNMVLAIFAALLISVLIKLFLILIFQKRQPGYA